MAVDILSPGPKPAGKSGDRIVLALSNLSRMLAGGDTAQAFQTVLDYARVLLGVDTAHLILKDLESQRLALAAERNLTYQTAASNPLPGEGLARAAMDGGELLSVDNLLADPRDGLGSLASLGYSSSLCAPILLGESAAGALVASSRDARTFTVGDVEILWELARALAEMMLTRGPKWVIVAPPVKQSTAQEAEHRLLELRVINRLSDAIIAATSLKEVLEVALDHGMEAVGAQIGSVMMFDQKSQRLTIGAARGLDEDIAQTGSRALGEGIAGWVAVEQKSLILSNVQSDARFRALVIRDEISSAMSVPLRTRDRLIGVLNLARLRGNAPFQHQHSELLETVANQIAIAAERMRLHQEMAKRSLQLSTLMEISKTITTMLDLGIVSEQVAAQARNLTRADATLLYYYDPINDRVRFAAQSGCPAGRLEQCEKLGRELALTAIRYNRLTLGEELTRDPRVHTLMSALKAGKWSALPFRHRGHRIAVIVTIPKQGRAIDPDSIETLEQFGSLAAVAIQNARLYNRQHAMASVMQETLLAPASVSVQGLEIAHRLIPQHEVGGDYYDFISLEDGRLGVVMADVMGSSVRAAVYTTVGKHAMRAYAREYECPAEVLTRLNRLIYQESEPELFVSLVYAVIDIAKAKITYAMAGHEPPLLHRNGSRRTEQLRAPGILLGVLKNTTFETRTRRFYPGDTLAFYTDGLTESPVHGRQFGVQRLSQLIRRFAGRSVQDIVDSVIASRMRFSHSHSTDDMALLIVRAAEQTGER